MITTTKTKSLSIKTSFINKQILIQMAKDGKDRPKYKTKEGSALCRYTTKNSGSYNESFDKLIKKQRPDWFIKSSDTMRKKLIQMAKDRKNKPSRKTKEGSAFYNYTCKSSKSYNESFDKQIRRLRPYWFVKSSDLMKKKLIQMAKDKKNKPSRKTKEGSALTTYTNKSSGSYDKLFDKQIRRLRPDWFEKSSSINKQLLIMMAKNGETRPKFRIKLGRYLSSYTYKSSVVYDESFTKKIRKLRPDWFKR